MEPVELGDVEVKDYDKSWAVTGTKCARTHNIVNSLLLEPEELEGAVDALLAAILKNAPIAVRYAKACINGNYDLSADESIALENHYFAKCFTTEDQKEGMAAFLEKRKATFKNE